MLSLSLILNLIRFSHLFSYWHLVSDGKAITLNSVIILPPDERTKPTLIRMWAVSSTQSPRWGSVAVTYLTPSAIATTAMNRLRTIKSITPSRGALFISCNSYKNRRYLHKHNLHLMVKVLAPCKSCTLDGSECH